MKRKLNGYNYARKFQKYTDEVATGQVTEGRQLTSCKARSSRFSLLFFLVQSEGTVSSNEVDRKSLEYPPPFEDEERRKEFVANVRLRCEKILKQVRLFKETCKVTKVTEDLADSSGSDSTTASTIEGESEEKLSMGSLTTDQLSQKLKQHIERISELLQVHDIPDVSSVKRFIDVNRHFYIFNFLFLFNASCTCCFLSST